MAMTHALRGYLHWAAMSATLIALLALLMWATGSLEPLTPFG